MGGGGGGTVVKRECDFALVSQARKLERQTCETGIRVIPESWLWLHGGL